MKIKKKFSTTQSDLLKYNGQDYLIIRPLIEGKEYDAEVGKMYRIRFSDEFETDAFEDEIFG